MKLTLLPDPHSVTCPACGAAPRNSCVDGGYERTSMHEARRRKFNYERAVSAGRPPLSTPEEKELERSKVRSVLCPTCGAETQERCRSRRPQGRLSNHSARTQLYDRTVCQ